MKRNWIASIAKAWQVIFWLALAVVILEAFILYRYPHLFTTWLFQVLLLLSVIIITYLLFQYEPSDERLLRKLNLHYNVSRRIRYGIHSVCPNILGRR